jgi:hypothetical protein
VLDRAHLAQRRATPSGISNAIYDPFSLVGGVKQPFAGNQIPLNRIDPVAGAASSFWPVPNRQGAANGANNYLANTRLNLNRNIVVGKLDHVVNEKDRLSARYYINNASSINDGSYGIPVADPLATNTDVRIQSILGTYTHTFSPSLLNNFEVSFMQRKFIQTRPGSGDNYAGKIGLNGVSDAAFPTLNVTGYALLGSQAIANSSLPASRLRFKICSSRIRFRSSWASTPSKPALNIAAGTTTNQRPSSSGNLVFNRLITDKPGASNTGDAYASFLLGAANSAAISKTDVIPSRASYWAAYVQDDFRVTDRLTLNAGLRWEVETPRYVDGNKLNGFDPVAINPVSGTPGVVTFAGENGVPRTSFGPPGTKSKSVSWLLSRKPRTRMRLPNRLSMVVVIDTTLPSASPMAKWLVPDSKLPGGATLSARSPISAARRSR